jgi:C-terminal processing protease CtpA/Prc
VGLGLLLKTENDGFTYVKETIQGFAASLQGTTMPNDCIIAVDGRSVEGWDLDAIKQLTFGEEGQPCQLTLRRGNETFTVNLVRVVPSQSQLD